MIKNFRFFWNINKKDIRQLITEATWHHGVDVVILAESQIAPATLLRTLNRDKKRAYHYCPIVGCDKIQIFASFHSEFILPVFETERLTVRHLALPGLIDILVAVVHFPSKLHWDDAIQALECVELSNSIKVAERQVGHTRTILVGDLNLNPYQSLHLTAYRAAFQVS